MNSNTGQITGTPTSAGTYNVTIFVSDGLTTVSRSFVWTVTSGTTLDRIAPLAHDHEPHVGIGRDDCQPDD